MLAVAGKEAAGADRIFSDGAISLLLGAVNALKNGALLGTALLLLEGGTFLVEALLLSVPEENGPVIEELLWLGRAGAEDDDNEKGLFDDSRSTGA